MTIAPPAFRRAMSYFATGITVVTTVHQNLFYGITVNAFCSVSLDPPLVLISIDKTSQTHSIIQQSKVYAVNILTAEQQYLSERFARKDTDQKSFADILLRTAQTGAPLFDECMVRLDCRVVAEYEGGDHTLFLGEVLSLAYPQTASLDGAHAQGGLEGQGIQEPEPLLFFRSQYRSLPFEAPINTKTG